MMLKDTLNWNVRSVTERSLDRTVEVSVVGEYKHPLRELSPIGLGNLAEELNDLLNGKVKTSKTSSEYYIKKVIFNGPATIVIWKDGTKTVVKAQEGDTFDPEKGLAMAISKKVLGNKGNYCEVFKKWIPEVDE